jgi:hypothetical protein
MLKHFLQNAFLREHTWHFNHLTISVLSFNFTDMPFFMYFQSSSYLTHRLKGKKWQDRIIFMDKGNTCTRSPCISVSASYIHTTAPDNESIFCYTTSLLLTWPASASAKRNYFSTHILVFTCLLPRSFQHSIFIRHIPQPRLSRRFTA